MASVVMVAAVMMMAPVVMTSICPCRGCRKRSEQNEENGHESDFFHACLHFAIPVIEITPRLSMCDWILFRGKKILAGLMLIRV
jgi:hypothetical protein